MLYWEVSAILFKTPFQRRKLDEQPKIGYNTYQCARAAAAQEKRERYSFDVMSNLI